MPQASRGPALPYRPLAGVLPVGRRWLVAPGRLQGVSLYAAEPMVVDTLLEVLDYRPAYEVIALACPVGLLDAPTRGGRACDREARRLLGWPRSGAIFSAPARAAVSAKTFDEARVLNGGSMSSALYPRLCHIAEVDAAIAPYWQRTVFEVHPELSFYQLNDDTPMHWGKHGDRGPAERRALIERRIPGVASLLDVQLRGVRKFHLLDAAACLWTARRIAGRVLSRVPEDPEWDETGLRMEIVR